MLNAAHIASVIAKQADNVDRLRRELEIAEAELRGMKMLQSQLLSTAHQDLPSRNLNIQNVKLETGYRGGRQPGAISQTWRMILSEMYWTEVLLDTSTSIDLIRDIARKFGLQMRPSEIETRMVHYTNGWPG